MIDAGLRVVTGLVLPSGWSEDGRVKSVAISAFDETDYLVAPGPLADALLPLLRREVEVRGRVGSWDSSSLTIEVESFQVKENGLVAVDD